MHPELGAVVNPNIMATRSNSTAEITNIWDHKLRHGVPIFARRARDAELLAPDVRRHSLPWTKADDARAWLEVLLAVRGGEDASAIEQLAAQGIEIVDVVFMAEEDGVDGGAVRGFGQLGH